MSVQILLGLFCAAFLLAGCGQDWGFYDLLLDEESQRVSLQPAPREREAGENERKWPKAVMNEAQYKIINVKRWFLLLLLFCVFCYFVLP